jgi:hypothetical protein
MRPPLTILLRSSAIPVPAHGWFIASDEAAFTVLGRHGAHACMFQSITPGKDRLHRQLRG